MRYQRGWMMWAVCLLWSLMSGGAEFLQSFSVRDHLRHAWTDELVRFPVAFAGEIPTGLTLVDAAGTPMPCQFVDLQTVDGQTTGSVWTVVSVAEKEEVTLHLTTGPAAENQLELVTSADGLVLQNEHLAVRLPRFDAPLPAAVVLGSLPTPMLGLRARDGDTWLGEGRWVTGETELLVTAASVEVVEEGPVRMTVRYRLEFADDRFYQAELSLGARQEVVLFTDDTDVDAEGVAFRISFQPGLEADRVFWRSNYYAELTKGLEPGPIEAEAERVIAKLCPWAYWWLKDQTTWAGFFREGAEPLLGVIGLRPSRWSPTQWAGFVRTAIPITARPGGGLDITLALLAIETDDVVTSAHRELAFTVGRASEHVTQDVRAVPLRGMLLKHSEFPLDEVKEFGFDFTRAQPDRPRPFLLFTQADIERARRQAQTVPMIKYDFESATTYLGRIGVDPVKKITSTPDGWLHFFRDNYVGNGLYNVAPQAFLGSDDPKYGIILAAGVKGLARQHLELFINAPARPTLGGNAHMAGTTMLRLLLAYDAIADTGLLNAEEKEEIEAALVFGGYVFDHPDYWNLEVGLCSANPNMTSLLKLPLGLVGLYMEGHPRAAHWLEYAEEELQRELREWIAPGGAWLECPMYQAPSLDGMFLLAQAIKNVGGKDYFQDPQFKATMEYYGFIQTAPDRRFPVVEKSDVPAPMTVPSIGDAFPNFTHPFNGWMARQTAESDPAYSARQQAYWAGQSFSCLNGGRAGFIPAMTDAELPVAPPRDTARAFEGFGNVMRTSWTDPRASYVSHRCGYFTHHYDPGDHNSFMYYAKGVPLCVDFGHRGATADEVRTMWKPMYHNTVSFDKAEEPGYWPSSHGGKEYSIAAQQVLTLPRSIDYSRGGSTGAGGQRHTRHLLLVKSPDPMGATYLVVRDRTVDGQPNQSFTWHLWCMAGEPVVTGSLAHFPGQFGVDLDVHLLSPAEPEITTESYGYEQWVNPWGKFREDQTAIHVRKQGSQEDFIGLLYPRAEGQGGAKVISGEDGGLQVTHMEGQDLLLLSPGEPITVTDGAFALEGEIAFARRYTNGALWLSLLAGQRAAGGGWALAGSGPVALYVEGESLLGESDGAAREIVITLPAAMGRVEVRIGDDVVPTVREQNRLRVSLPAGPATFSLALLP